MNSDMNTNITYNYKLSNYKDYLTFIIMGDKEDGYFDFACKGNYYYHYQGLRFLYNQHIKKWYEKSIDSKDRFVYVNKMIEKNYIVFLNNSYDNSLVGSLYLPNIITKKQYDKFISFKEEFNKSELLVKVYDVITHKIVNDNSYITEEGITEFNTNLNVEDFYVEDNGYYYFKQFIKNKDKVKAM